MYWCENRKISIFARKASIRGNFIQGIDCAHFLSKKNYLDLDSGEWSWCIDAKIENFLFSPVHQLHSLNQGQDNFFMRRKCAQSIPRIKLPPEGCFQDKNRNFFDFHVNTPNPYPESGSRKCFHASRMRAIDFPHQITPIWVICSKRIFQVPKITKMPFFDSSY
jgi:hypothetical protein